MTHQALFDDARRLSLSFVHALRRRALVAGGLAILFSALVPPGQYEIAWAAGNYSTVVGSDNPVGYWRLDETTGTTAADSASGHNNPLTYQGGYTLMTQPGAISGDPDPGVALDGATGTITATKATTTSTTNWSLEAWVNPSTLPQAGVIAYDGQIGSNGYGFAIGSTNGTSLSSGSHLIGILGSVTLFDSGYNFSAPNAWYHVVMTRDTSTTRLYVNAVAQTTTSTSTPVAPGARFSLGSGFTSTPTQMFPLAGSVDEAASYNSLLSAGRVQAHYSEAASAQSAFGNWLSVSPSNPPSTRFEPAMGWDAGHNKVVLFGGKNSAGSAIQETWTWDGTTWTKLTPSTQPSARWGAQLVYDTSLGKMVLFGGTAGKKAMSDTWTWDGTTWAQLSPGTSPSARYDYGLAYDSGNSVVVLFGGISGSSALQDTFTFNGTTWTAQSPSAKPSIRSQVAMTYDTATSTTVLFGGVSGSTYNAETWTWNGSIWTQKSPGASPSARSDAGLAYNSLTSSLVLIGGVNGSSYFGDTWTWDGSNWTQQLPASSPTVRAGAGFAYNGVIGADSLFGGLSGSTFLNDTRTWATPPGAPTSVTATAGNAQATISWTAPANGGSAITGYVVTPYAGSRPGTSATPSASPVTITGLTNGTTYTFKVAAKNAIGTGPVGTSNAVTPASTPGAPTNVVAAPGNAQASVSWTAPGSGGSPITGYTVTPFDNNTAGTPQNVGASTTSATFTSLTNGHSEYFTVYATNAIGNGPTATSNTVTVGAPTAPGSVSATAGANQATVTWTASTANGSAITGYTVVGYIGTQATTRVSTGASATQATLYGLQGQTAYTFQVTATNSIGTGPAGISNAVTPTGTGSTYETTVAGDSPSAYWRLDDPSGTTATDVTGNDNGQYNGTVTLSQTGLIPSDPDPSALFDGSSGYVQANTIPALQGGNTRSVEFWLSTTNPNQMVFFDSGTTGTNGQSFEVALTQTNGVGGSPAQNTPGLYIAFWGVDDVYVPGLNLADGRTHHIVITLSGRTLNVFVDGRTPSGFVYNAGWPAITSQPFTLPVAPSTASNPVLIGHGRQSIYTGSSYFSGTLDEVAVYPTALTATQVQNHESAAQILLAAPVLGTVTPGANQITVTWSDSANPKAFSGYIVTAYSGNIPTVSKAVASNATTATLTGLSGGTPYTVQVMLSNAFGSFSTTSSAVTPTGSTSTYASTVQSTSPILYYRLSDSGTTIAADSSGNGQNGVYVGTLTTGAAGALANDSDTAVNFAGGTGYLAYSGTNMPTGNSARTVELWVKTTSTAWNQELLQYGDCAGFGNDFDVRFNGGSQIGIGVCSSGTNPYVNLPYSIANGQWHQIILTFDGSNFVVYVDGNRASSRTYGGLSTTRTTVYIGDQSNLQNTFQGSLDEVAVYSGAFTASQAMAHFLASGNSQVAPPATVTATAGANSATITWTASPTNPYPILGYQVTAFSGTQAVNSVATGPSTTSVTITGLQGGVAYTVAVSAINNFGFGSSTSSTAVTPTGATSTYASTVIGTGPAGTGPVLYYRVGEASGSPYAADSSGSNGWGIYRSGATLGGAGALPSDPDTSLSGSFYFNTGNGLPTGNTSRSLELWLKTTSTANMALADWGDYSNGNTAFTVQLAGGNRVWINLNNQTNPAINSPYSLANGQWHYVVLTWNGSVFTLYVDGTSAGTWNQAALATTQSPLSVGLTIQGGAAFSGNLDEVAVYNRALSQSEITAHFAASGNSQPSAPAAGSVGATAGVNQATVSWNSVTNPSPVTGYLVVASSSGIEAESTVVSATTQSVVMSGLQGGVSYTFSVAAQNNFGFGPSTSSGAVTPTGNSTTYRSTVMGSTPLAYYRLDDTAATAADSSGNNLIGSYFGTYTQGVQGALTDDPDAGVSNAGLQVNQITTFPFGSSARSVEVWFNTTSTSNQILGSYGDGNAGGTLFQWFIASSGNQLTLASTTASWSFNTPYNVDNGQWHMADVTYDGTNLTMYVDSTSLGSQAIGGLNTDAGSVFATGTFSGSLDELSIYSRALTSTDVGNHWSAAGAGVPAAPSNVIATAGVGSAVVSWTPPPLRGAPITSYTITPSFSGGGSSLAPFSVTGSTTSSNIPYLPSGSSIFFSVAAVNKYGTGPAANSAAVSILGYNGSPGMDRFLAIGTAGNPSRGIYYEGWYSNAPISQTSLSTWTVEGWIWAVGYKNTSTGNMAWGLLNSFSYRNPNHALISIPSPDVPMAGINFNIGNLHGINACCDVSFVWPHNGNVGFGTDGQFTPANPSLTSTLGTNSPAYIALDFDGTNVRGYVNGSLLFTQADNAALPAGAVAGFMDQTELAQGAFDGFRVSNVARYTGSSFTVPSADLGADTNTLVDYNFDNYAVGKQPSILLTPFAPWGPVSFGNWPDSSSNHNAASFMGVSDPWEIGWFADSPLLFQPFELGPGIAPNELADECNGVNTGSGNFCTRTTDLSLPGRGPALALQRTYNSFGASTLGIFGYGWSSTYDAHLTIDGSGNVTITDPLGGGESFQNQGGTYVGPSFVSSTLTLAGGNYTLTDKHGGQVVFDSTGRLIRQVDRNGYTTTLAYSAGRLTGVTDPAGRQLAVTYGTNGLVSLVSDGTRSVSYTYDANLNLTSVNDVLGGATAFTYDSSHRMLTDKDPICSLTTGCNGIVNVYDGNGRVSQQTDPLSHSTTYTYNVSWPLFTTTMTDPLGNQNVYDYALGMPIDTIQAANTSLAETTTYAYDPASMGIAAVTNDNGETTTATYDTKTNRLSSTDSIGNTTSYTYNSLNEVLTVKDPLGVTTTYTYDANGNPLTASTPLVGTSSSQVVTNAYGDTTHPGDVTAQTDATNRVVTFTYDSFGNRASATDSLGNKTTYVYDSLSDMTSTVSPLGNVTGGNPAAYTTAFTYNAAREQLTITDPLGHKIVNVYDAGGHLIKATDANGNVTTFSYDLDGHPTSSTTGFGTPLASTKQTTYNADAAVVSQVDGLNHTLASYTYDALNRETSSSDGLSRTTTYTYDNANRLISSVNPLNQTTSYSYDSAGRLTAIVYSDGTTPSVTYTYDADGQLLTMVDGTGTTTRVWDSLHRLVQVTDGAGNRVGYGYDLSGRSISIAYPGGSCSAPVSLCVTRQYDSLGRLSSIQDWLTNQTTFSYDANSNMTGITYPNGVVATLTFNASNQLVGISDAKGGTTILSLNYTRDSNAQLAAENSINYGYNSLNQLASAGAQTYTYDADGRLTQSVSGSTTTNYTYDNSDQVLSSAVVGGSTTNYGYDSAGRRITSGATTLTWSQANRLSSFGSADTYTYNGSGIRMSKTVSGQAETFVWDMADGLPLLLKDGSTTYVTGPAGLVLEQINGSTVNYYQQDQSGSTRVITDSTGATAATYSFDAYGNLAAQTGTLSNPFLYSGQYRDAESGLYYLRARYYDPSSAQFISRDPKLNKTWAPYGYVSDNPLNHSDASGLDGFGDFLGGLGDAIGGAISGAFNYASGLVSASWTNLTASISNVGSFLSSFGGGFSLHPNSDAMAWVLAGAALGALVGLAVVTGGDPLVVGAAIGLGSYLIVEAVSGKTPTWQGAVTATVMGAVGIAWVGGATAIIGAFFGEGLGACLAGGVLGGAATGIATVLVYNKLEGKETTEKEIEDAAVLGAVFGLAGGFGEYATTTELSGGLGLNAIDDEAAGNMFDLAIGTLGFAAGNILDPTGS